MKQVLRISCSLIALMVITPCSYSQIKQSATARYTPYRIQKLKYTSYSLPLKKPQGAIVKTPISNGTNIPIVTPRPTLTPVGQILPPIAPVTPVPQKFVPSNTPFPQIKPIPPIQDIAISTPVRKSIVSPTPKLPLVAARTPISTPKNTPTPTPTPTPAPTVTTPKPVIKVTSIKPIPFNKQWKNDYEKAYKTSIKEKGKILVFIGFESCHFCKELKKDIQSLYIGKYETVYIDREKNNQYKKYFSKYKVSPVLLMIDSSNSKIIKKMIGYEHSDFKKLSAFVK